LTDLGITKKKLDIIRSKSPKARILETAIVALEIDDEPNADLIDFVAGMGPEGALSSLLKCRRAD